MIISRRSFHLRSPRGVGLHLSRLIFFLPLFFLLAVSISTSLGVSLMIVFKRERYSEARGVVLNSTTQGTNRFPPS